MPRRSSRRSTRAPQIQEPDRSEFIADLGRVRRKAASLMGVLHIGSAEYRALGTYLGQVDDLAEVLTGDRERFWTPPTSV